MSRSFIGVVVAAACVGGTCGRLVSQHSQHEILQHEQLGGIFGDDEGEQTLRSLASAVPGLVPLALGDDAPAGAAAKESGPPRFHSGSAALAQAAEEDGDEGPAGLSEELKGSMDKYQQQKVEEVWGMLNDNTDLLHPNETLPDVVAGDICWLQCCGSEHLPHVTDHGTWGKVNCKPLNESKSSSEGFSYQYFCYGHPQGPGRSAPKPCVLDSCPRGKATRTGRAADVRSLEGMYYIGAGHHRGSPLFLHAWGGSNDGSYLRLHGDEKYARRHANSLFELRPGPTETSYYIKASDKNLFVSVWGGSRDGAYLRLHGNAEEAKESPQSLFEFVPGGAARRFFLRPSDEELWVGAHGGFSDGAHVTLHGTGLPFARAHPEVLFELVPAGLAAPAGFCDVCDGVGGKHYEAGAPLPPPPTAEEPPAAWVQCAEEGGSCSCDGAVRFGLRGRWSAPQPSDGEADVGCLVSVFGDPVPGVAKVCQCSGWRPCAAEGGQCKCGDHGSVRFGTRAGGAAAAAPAVGSFPGPFDGELQQFPVLAPWPGGAAAPLHFTLTLWLRCQRAGAVGRGVFTSVDAQPPSRGFAVFFRSATQLGFSVWGNGEPLTAVHDASVCDRSWYLVSATLSDVAMQVSVDGQPGVETAVGSARLRPDSGQPTVAIGGPPPGAAKDGKKESPRAMLLAGAVKNAAVGRWLPPPPATAWANAPDTAEPVGGELTCSAAGLGVPAGFLADMAGRRQCECRAAPADDCGKRTVSAEDWLSHVGGGRQSSGTTAVSGAGCDLPGRCSQAGGKWTSAGATLQMTFPEAALIESAVLESGKASSAHITSFALEWTDEPQPHPGSAWQRFRGSYLSQPPPRAGFQFVAGKVAPGAGASFTYPGNNGAVPCKTFCSSDWHGQLESMGWTGACCGSAKDRHGHDMDCAHADGVSSAGVTCVCDHDGKGWLPRGDTSGHSGRVCGARVKTLAPFRTDAAALSRFEVAFEPVQATAVRLQVFATDAPDKKLFMRSLALTSDCAICGALDGVPSRAEAFACPVDSSGPKAHSDAILCPSGTCDAETCCEPAPAPAPTRHFHGPDGHGECRESCAFGALESGQRLELSLGFSGTWGSWSDAPWSAEELEAWEHHVASVVGKAVGANVRRVRLLAHEVPRAGSIVGRFGAWFAASRTVPATVSQAVSREFGLGEPAASTRRRCLRLPAGKRCAVDASCCSTSYKFEAGETIVHGVNATVDSHCKCAGAIDSRTAECVAGHSYSGHVDLACPEGMFGTDGVCKLCSECPVGQYACGGCKGDQDTVCCPCHDQCAQGCKAAGNIVGTQCNACVGAEHEGRCVYYCPFNFFRRGTRCVQCSACPVGQRRTSGCEGTTDSRCSGCSGAPWPRYQGEPRAGLACDQMSADAQCDADPATPPRWTLPADSAAQCQALCSGLGGEGTPTGCCEYEDGCGFIGVPRDMEGQDVRRVTCSGSDDAERDAACCAKCRAEAQCEFWVRATDSSSCWLKKGFTGFGAASSSNRRGGFRSLQRLMAAMHSDVFDRMDFAADRSAADALLAGVTPLLAKRLSELPYGGDGCSNRAKAPTARLLADAVTAEAGKKPPGLASFGSCSFHSWLSTTEAAGSAGKQAARCGATWVHRPRRYCSTNNGALQNVGGGSRGTVMECKARCMATAGCNCIVFNPPSSGAHVAYHNVGYCELRKDCTYGRLPAQQQMCSSHNSYDMHAVQPGAPSEPCTAWECSAFFAGAEKKYRALCNGKDAAVANPPEIPGGFGPTFDSVFDDFGSCAAEVALKAADRSFECPTTFREDEWRCQHWRGYWTALCNGAPASASGVFDARFHHKWQCEQAVSKTGGGFRATHKDFVCPNKWCDLSTLTPGCNGHAAAGANPTLDKQSFYCDNECSGCVAEGATRCNACHRYKDQVAGPFGREESTCVHHCPESKYDSTMCLDFGRYASGTSVLVKDVARGSFDVGGDCPWRGVIRTQWHISHGECARQCQVNPNCWGYSYRPEYHYYYYYHFSSYCQLKSSSCGGSTGRGVYHHWWHWYTPRHYQIYETWHELPGDFNRHIWWASYVPSLSWCKRFCSNYNSCVGIGYSHKRRLCTMHSQDQQHYDLTRSNYGADMRYHKRGRGVSDAYQCQAVCAGYGGCTAFSFDTTLRRCELHTNSGAVPQHTRNGDINWISGLRRCLPGVCEFCRLQDGCPHGFTEVQTCAPEHNRLCLLPTWVKCADEGGTCSCTGRVRYGGPSSGHETGGGFKAGHWVTKTGVDGSVGCNNGVFGDPLYGSRKRCECQAMADD